MEAIAVAASIAGLLSLAGQCVNGAETLKNLFAEVGATSKTIDAFLQDINSLLRTLHDVEELVEAMSRATEHTDSSLDAASLQIQLEDCLRSIASWLRTAKDIKPISGNGAKSWARRFWIAVNKESMSSIRKEISRRRIEISTSLLILSNTRELHGFRTVERVEEKVDEALSYSSNIGDVLQRLQTLDATAQNILSNSEGSMRSLQSMCSSMSKFSSHNNWNPLTNEVSSASSPGSSIPQQGPFQYQGGSPYLSPALSARSSGGLGPIDEPRLDPLYPLTPSPAVLDPIDEPWTDAGYASAPTIPVPSPEKPSGDGRNATNMAGELQQNEKELGEGKGPAWRHQTKGIIANKPFQCASCTEQFNAKLQLVKHQKVKHPHKFFGSCGCLSMPESAYYRSNGKLLCAYCGEPMSWESDRKEEDSGHRHLLKDHRFGECDAQRRYTDKKDFFLHLQNFHGASASGQWIIALENACVLEEPDFGTTLFNTVEPSINRAAADLEKLWNNFKQPSSQHHVQWRTESALVNNLLLGPYDDLNFTERISKLRLAALCKEEVELLNLVLSNWPLENEETKNYVACSMLMQRRIDLKIMREGILKNVADIRPNFLPVNKKEKEILRRWERTLCEKRMDESPETSAVSNIRTQSYDSSLLTTWTGNRDRVNRWMLHVLGSSADQAEIHRSMMHDRDISVQSWSRLVLKFWFLDEAALGVEFEPSLSVGAAHSPDASSLWSSMFETCKSHLDEPTSERDDTKMLDTKSREVIATGPL